MPLSSSVLCGMTRHSSGDGNGAWRKNETTLLAGSLLARSRSGSSSSWCEWTQIMSPLRESDLTTAAMASVARE
eukprot:3962056-Pleurochrysis_carterae.AAC.1